MILITMSIAILRMLDSKRITWSTSVSERRCRSTRVEMHWRRDMIRFASIRRNGLPMTTQVPNGECMMMWKAITCIILPLAVITKCSRKQVIIPNIDEQLLKTTKRKAIKRPPRIVPHMTLAPTQILMGCTTAGICLMMQNERTSSRWISKARRPRENVKDSPSFLLRNVANKLITNGTFLPLFLFLLLLLLPS
jgi:hypothetical protein